MIRKKPKVDKLQELFPTIGTVVHIDKIFEETGIKNYNTLKALCSYMRKAKHIPAENRVDIRISHHVCERVL